MKTKLSLQDFLPLGNHFPAAQRHMRVARDGKQLSQEQNAVAAFLALAQTAAETSATALVTTTTTTVQFQKMKILYWKR